MLRFRYQTLEFPGTDIHVRTLRDRQQFADDDGVAAGFGICSASWPMFGVLWDASSVLAHHMSDYAVDGLRVLEVGCGIALASLVLNHRHADITSTDHHPEAGTFLQVNTELNGDAGIPFFRAGWSDADSGMGVFDLIIGSDLLYDDSHIELLSGFIDRHAGEHGVVLLVDPGRGIHSRFSRKMVALGFAHTQSRPETVAGLDAPFKGVMLRYERQ